MIKNIVKIFIILTLISILIPYSNSQLVDLIIYKDGIVHVKISIEVDENLPYIRIPLIGMNISNVIIYNENKELLDYEIEDNEIEIYSLGSKNIILEYYTQDLTFKLRNLWTFKIDSPYEIRVIFPDNATIIGINAIPKQISIENNKVIMVFNPGYYEVDYTIPIIFETIKETETIQLFWIIPIIIIIISIFILIKKKKGKEKVSDYEERVLNFIKKNGGKALEAEIRTAFPDIPRTTLWRMLKRLEKKGIVKIKKVGLQNLVELI